MEEQLLIGSRNLARIEMVKKILESRSIQIFTLDQLDIRAEIEEDGKNTEANAEKKARAYFSLSGKPTLSMDGGVVIDRFPADEQPGVRVNRLAGLGPKPSAEEIMRYYIRVLERAGGTSLGTWTGTSALALAADKVILDTYHFTVLFTSQPKGRPSSGRALDAIMIDPNSGRYYTEMALEDRPYYTAVKNFLIKYLT